MKEIGRMGIPDGGALHLILIQLRPYADDAVGESLSLSACQTISSIEFTFVFHLLGLFRSQDRCVLFPIPLPWDGGGGGVVGTYSINAYMRHFAVIFITMNIEQSYLPGDNIPILINYPLEVFCVLSCLYIVDYIILGND